MKAIMRYFVLLPWFLCPVLLLFYPAAGVFAGEGALFYIESPVDLLQMRVHGVEIWDRFWIGGREVAIVSVPDDLQSSLGNLGVRFGRIGPLGEDEALFVITAYHGIDLSLLSRYSTVILHDDHVALVKTDQTSAELLSAKGMEIRGVVPPPRSAPSATIPTRSSRFLSWDPGIQQIINEVNLTDVGDFMDNLSGENSVIIGGSPYTILTRNSLQTTPIEKATQYCYEQLQGLGLSVSYDNYTWNGNNWRNVVGEQVGLVNPDDIYIICGHLDDMPPPPTPSAPGADDNASGSNATLIAATILSNYDFENTIRYVLFTGEEQGLRGSYYYVQDLVLAGDNVLGALNFDMIAYDGNSDGVIEVHCGTIAASETLGDLLIDTISEYSLSLNPVKITNGSTTASDHARFWIAGYPAILGIEDTWFGSTSDFNPFYHKVTDTRANCNMPYMTEYVKAAVGTIARLGVLMASPTVTSTSAITSTPTSTPTPTITWTVTTTPTVTSTPTISPTLSPTLSPTSTPSATPTGTPTITSTPTITNTPLPVIPLAVMKNEGGDYNLYGYEIPVAGDWTYWDAKSRNPSPLAMDLWVIPSGNNTLVMTEVDSDGDGRRELAVLKADKGFDQNLYIYNAPDPGSWTYWNARARNPSPMARDLWVIPAGNDTSLIADAGSYIAAMKKHGVDYNLYLFDNPEPGDWTYWDAAARNPSPLARDLWIIPHGNDAVAMCGLDTNGDEESDSLLVVRNEGGDYNIYLWNMLLPGDWSFADATARNPSARALDMWVIPQGNDIALVTGIRDGASFDRLGVIENLGGDYSFYIWNAPRPGDTTQAQAAARNPSPLARDAWIIPSGNDAAAIAAPL